MALTTVSLSMTEAGLGLLGLGLGLGLLGLGLLRSLVLDGVVTNLLGFVCFLALV